MLLGISSPMVADIQNSMRKPSVKTILGVVRTEAHLVHFNSHPTGIYRPCSSCSESGNNNYHIIYDCPLAKYVWMILSIAINIITGIDMRITVKITLLNNINRKHIKVADIEGMQSGIFILPINTSHSLYDWTEILRMVEILCFNHFWYNRWSFWLLFAPKTAENTVCEGLITRQQIIPCGKL